MDQAVFLIAKGRRPVFRSLTVAARGRSPLTQPERFQPERPANCEALPVWFSALMAANCQARSSESRHAVSWCTVEGRAVYTNVGRHPEHIEPLGVTLPPGGTIEVYWSPGETAYTVEVDSDAEKCA